MLFHHLLIAINFTENISVFPSQPSVTLPEPSLLISRTVLACGFTPISLTMQDYRTRWITPAREIVVSITGHYIVINGNVRINASQFPGTVIAIQNLSYQDAGQYTCEGQATNTADPNVWASATIDLQLNSKLICT